MMRRILAASAVLASTIVPLATTHAGVRVSVSAARVTPAPIYVYESYPVYPRPIYVRPRPVIVERPILIERSVVVEPPAVERPVVVAEPVAVERKAGYDEPVVARQPKAPPPPTPIIVSTQAPAPLVPIEVDQPPAPAKPRRAVIVREPVVPPLPIRFKGKLPVGPTKLYTCKHDYTKVEFSVAVPGWADPRKTEIHKHSHRHVLKYEHGEVEIEFKRDGTAKVEYKF